MLQTLLTHLESGILTVTINRPDKLNALNRTVLTELNEVLNEIAANADIRAVLITGAGPKAFVAGADISEFTNLSKEEAMAMARYGQQTFFRIEKNNKPIVAAVNGFALGGGCELAMACHFRLANDQAKFGQPEVNLGLIPGYGGTQRLVQLVGKGRALELMMSGQMVNAQQALLWGLVNRVTPPDQLIEEARKLLLTINSKAPLAVAACISAANSVYEETQNGYDQEIALFGNCFTTEDKKEGVQAFLEKRPPSFKGK